MYSRGLSIDAPIETEIKLPVHSSKWAQTLLAAHGFVIRQSRHFEANMVLDTKEGTLRQANLLIRLRQVDETVILTYKGPPLEGAHKSREEVEVHVDSLPPFLYIWEKLGYHVQFRYEKYRTVYHRLGDPGVVTLDETPVGVFLEIEGPSSWIDGVAKRLGFGPGQYITDSYGQLYLRWCQENGVAPSHMVFSGPLAEMG